MESIDNHSTMTPIDKIKVINGTTLGRLVDSRDTNREAKADTETARWIIMNAHAHQVIFAS